MKHIRYISYGPLKTGGYRHEILLYNSVVQFYRNIDETYSEIIRRPRLFESFISHLDLLLWGFLKSNADINIVPARLAIPAILRNYFNRSEIWIVLHNHDTNDGKSNSLNHYLNRLFGLLKKRSDSRFKIIAVSPYWVNYFQNQIGLPNVHLFPNLFDTDVYKPYQQNEKYPWIHLGQFSSKNDPDIIRLAGALTADGYYCYFSTLDPDKAMSHNGKFEVICFHGFEDYLEQMSRSCCTLALTQINEGWNRVAHESILVGTPVIGYNKGGLGDLMKASRSVVVRDIDEAYTVIKESLWVLPEIEFNSKYDKSSGINYIANI